MARSIKLQSIFVTGEKVDSWSIKNFTKQLLAVVKEEWPEDTGYVLTGSSRFIEQKVVTVCKQAKIRTLVAPANFQMLSGSSAEQLRNADILHTFKPSLIIIFSNNPLEKDSVLVHLQKIAYKANIPVKILKKK